MPDYINVSLYRCIFKIFQSVVESVPFCGVFIETIRGKVLVAVPGLIPQEELCPLETPQGTESTAFSKNTKWF